VNALGQGICLTLLGAGLVALPGAAAPAAPVAAAADKSLVQQMKDGADGSVKITRKTATAAVGFARARGADADLFPGRGAGSASGAAAKSDAFLDKYAEVFGAPADQLVRDSVRDNDLGWTVTYVQRYRGVKVFGAMLRAHVSSDGDLTSVNGYAAPELDMSVTPRLSAAQAGRAATAAVKADPPGHEEERADASGVRAVATELVVYRTGVPRGAQGAAVLAYVVEVSNGANVRDMVFLDANTGKVVNRYSLVHNALERHLIEASGSADPSTFVEVWKEGDPFPGGLNQDQQNEVLGTGESYWFFENTFGRDSYDGLGHSMTTVNNDGRINCPNANWNGVTTNYCNGVTSDDVVAHEWGHAYTEYTWDGIYQWQPGALNEAYSDIWGETVDLINGRMDADEGDITTPRPVGQCSTHSPAQPLLTINSPAEIAKNCATGGAAFGPQLDATGITDDLVLGLDGDEDGDGDPNPFDLQGSVYDGCSPFTNGADLVGKIVMVNRGLCGFEVKARNINAAGGVGAVIANRDPAVFTMSGDAEPDPTISTVMIGRDDWQLIVGKIATTPVNVTMKDASGPRVDSYRWLMGEDSSAFGGAIRDMWHPNCYGDPGKVSDAQYVCTTDDGGGVHSNSGVPNHGYALLVDGGSYNDVTVTGIGLDKAAAIYFRAMSEFQTPTTDFTDHADALEAACAELDGQDVLALSTEEDAVPAVSGTIGAADCAQVTNAIAAVELRTEPVQCDFQPLLDPDAPALCGSGTETETVWTEDFEDGLNGWGTAQQVVYPGASGAPWVADSDLPGGREGTAAYGPAPNQGQCDGSAGDFSSRDSIISPMIKMPESTNELFVGQKLSFDHYVATETGFDGGNVKFRRSNQQKWQVVPASAYVFNAPSQLSSAAEGNTNPMAGEPGFTGTDGGEVFGSWGQSQIDLEALKIKGGKVQFRFDIGRDGCGGIDGWYVDDIQVTVCTPVAQLAREVNPG
jgi:Zn-dependent metalloprotease